ncbi:MAG: hypothetical protein AAF717_14845 [Bacteroidota bacterium]
MKRWTYFTVGFILIFLFSSCELDSGENFHFEPLEITGADVPDSFTLNRTHVIDVSILRTNSCTFFQGFDVTEEEGGVLNIVAIGSVLTNDDCSTVDDTLSSAFNLTAIFNGTYLLRFYAGNDAEGTPQFLEYEVPVETIQ